MVNEGEVVSKGQRLLVLHSPDKIWVETNIRETDISRLKLGQLVKIEGVTITGNSGETTFINGKVYTLTQGSDTFTLRTSFYNFNGENLPTSAFDIVGIISERSDVGLHLVPRNYSDTTLSIDNIDVSVVNVYPNPVETSLYFSGLNEISRVTLYDLTGKLYLEATTNSSLDLSSLKKGIYILKLDNTKSSNIYKIVKQ